jgi:hypothetical protein
MAAKELELALPRYRPSGSTRLTIVPFSLAALAAAALVGIIYTFVASFIPLVMVTIFLVFGLGFAVGCIARFTCQLAHCRNRMLGLTLGIVCACAAVIASYWCHFALDKRNLLTHVPANQRAIVEKAFTFNAWVDLRKEVGWRVKGNQLNGAAVTGVWIFEALFVFIFATVLGWLSAAEPYCEQCRAWPKAHKLSLRGRDAQEFFITARSGAPLGALQLPRSDRPDVALLFENRICETCGNGFLDVHEESVTLKDNKPQTTKRPIASSILLDKPACDKFLAATHESVS